MPKTDNLALTREDIFVQRTRSFPNLPKILTEGDSWFDLPFPNRNIVDQFITHFPGEACWLRLEHSGDEIHQMLTEPQLSTLRGKMIKYRFDAILISGGGNDLVDENLAPILNRWVDGMTAEDCLDEAKLTAQLGRIENDYRALLALRDQHQPGCPIITHGYDHAIPQDRGVKLFLWQVKGPWIWPRMINKGISDPDIQRDIARLLIDRFNARIATLSENPVNKFLMADTRKTLAEADWGDELHPTERGFQKIASRLLPHLRQACPGSFKGVFPLS